MGNAGEGIKPRIRNNNSSFYHAGRAASPGVESCSRLAGYNKFKEKEPSWRDVWTIMKFQKTNGQIGKWEVEMCNVSTPPELILKVQELRRKLDEEDSSCSGMNTTPH